MPGKELFVCLIVSSFTTREEGSTSFDKSLLCPYSAGRDAELQ